MFLFLINIHNDPHRRVLHEFDGDGHVLGTDFLFTFKQNFSGSSFALMGEHNTVFHPCFRSEQFFVLHLVSVSGAIGVA
ncbi:MAG: hypothetical protein RSB39_04400, partial [Oscillospiraceae bacterium]